MKIWPTLLIAWRTKQKAGTTLFNRPNQQRSHTLPCEFQPAMPGCIAIWLQIQCHFACVCCIVRYLLSVCPLGNQQSRSNFNFSSSEDFFVKRVIMTTTMIPFQLSSDFPCFCSNIFLKKIVHSSSRSGNSGFYQFPKKYVIYKTIPNLSTCIASYIIDDHMRWQNAPLQGGYIGHPQHADACQQVNRAAVQSRSTSVRHQAGSTGSGQGFLYSPQRAKSTASELWSAHR